jgi:hypothetical protein
LQRFFATGVATTPWAEEKLHSEPILYVRDRWKVAELATANFREFQFHALR